MDHLADDSISLRRRLTVALTYVSSYRRVAVSSSAESCPDQTTFPLGEPPSPILQLAPPIHPPHAYPSDSLRGANTTRRIYAMLLERLQVDLEHQQAPRLHLFVHGEGCVNHRQPSARSHGTAPQSRRFLTLRLHEGGGFPGGAGEAMREIRWEAGLTEYFYAGIVGSLLEAPQGLGSRPPKRCATSKTTSRLGGHSLRHAGRSGHPFLCGR